MRNERYLRYVAVTKDAAERRSWTFYEAVNIVLDDLDKELETRGHRFVRYADDFIETPRADPHAGCCEEGEREIPPYLIGCCYHFQSTSRGSVRSFMPSNI